MIHRAEPESPPSKGKPTATDRIIGWIKSKKLEMPAVLALQMHRPLMPLAWPAAMIFGPLVAPLFGPGFYDKIEALKDPGLLDRLIRRLESDGDDTNH
jgi:hypothetical protein